MATPNSGADALRVQATVPVVSLDRLGELPGVLLYVVGARNGPGIGYLACIGDDKGLAWKAPGSTQFGVPAVTLIDDQLLLEDGLDASKWVWVTARPAYLVAGSVCRVYLRDRYQNAIGGSDVTAAQAAAGNVASWSFDLVNSTGPTFHQVKAWIDPTVVGVEISDDGATWVAPTSEETALGLADIAKWGADTVHVRRTIAAGAAADPLVLNHLHFAFMRA